MDNFTTEEINTLLDSIEPSGQKFDNGKLPWHLLPFDELESVVRVLEFGAKKYSENNWQKIDNADTRYFDAAMRHLIAWKNGELNDTESNLPHLSHAICCLLFLDWFDNTPESER